MLQQNNQRNTAVQSHWEETRSSIAVNQYMFVVLILSCNYLSYPSFSRDTHSRRRASDAAAPVPRARRPISVSASSRVGSRRDRSAAPHEVTGARRTETATP